MVDSTPFKVISIQSDKSLLIWSFHVRASNLSAGTLDLNVKGIVSESVSQ